MYESILILWQGRKTMTAIDRTIYRRMKRSYATKELIEAYTPTEEERRFVNTMTRTTQNHLNLLLWIKLFPRLWYLPPPCSLPSPLFIHIPPHLNFPSH